MQQRARRRANAATRAAATPTTTTTTRRYSLPRGERGGSRQARGRQFPSGGSLAPLVPHKTSPLIGHGSSIERVVTRVSQSVARATSSGSTCDSPKRQPHQNVLTCTSGAPADTRRAEQPRHVRDDELPRHVRRTAGLGCRGDTRGPSLWAPSRRGARAHAPRRAVTSRRHGSAAGRCRRTAAVTSRRHGSAAGGCRRAAAVTSRRHGSAAGRCRRRRVQV